MARAILCAAIAWLAMIAAAGTASAQATTRAKADMIDSNGKSVGQVSFTQMAQGVLIRVELDGVPPGWHGIHIHETASCEPPFASAGGHFNPDRVQHGFDGDGPHVGDLPNIFADDSGKARGEIFNGRIALVEDQPTDVNALNRALGAVQSAVGVQAYNLFDGNGSAVVVHAEPDDYETNPAGASGSRIACGVVQRR